MSSLNETVKKTFYNATPVFKTMRQKRIETSERNNNILPLYVDTRQRKFAKSLSRKIGKNVRIIKNQKFIDSFKVQESQNCLLKITDVLWDIFKDPKYYNSRFLAYDDDNEKKILITEAKEGKQERGFIYETMGDKQVRVLEHQIRKEYIVSTMIRRASDYLYNDPKCQKLLIDLADKVENYPRSHVTFREIFEIANMKGLDFMQTTLGITASINQETKEAYEKMRKGVLRYGTGDDDDDDDENEAQQSIHEANENVNNYLDVVDPDGDIAVSDATAHIRAAHNVNNAMNEVINRSVEMELLNRANIVPEQETQPEWRVIEGDDQEIEGGGVLSQMDDQVKNIAGDDVVVVVAPGNPELEGKDTHDFIKEFTGEQSVEPSLIPSFSQPSITIPSFTNAPTFNKQTTNENKEKKDSTIQLIEQILDDKMKAQEFEKVSNEDMVNIISSIMVKHQITNDILTSKDIADIIKDFYKKYPNHTLEPKPKILSLPENSDDNVRLGVLLDWLVTHKGLAITKNNVKISPIEALKKIVEVLELTKPEGKARTYPKYKWIFDRDLKDITITGNDEGVPVTITIPGRFGFSSLNSKFEKQYLEALDRTMDNIMRRKGELTDERKKEIIRDAQNTALNFGLVYVKDPLKIINMSKNEIKNAPNEFLNDVIQSFRMYQQNFVINEYKNANGDVTKMKLPFFGAVGLANRYGVYTKNDAAQLNPELASLFNPANEKYLNEIMSQDFGTSELKRWVVSAYEDGAMAAKKYPDNFIMQDLNEIDAFKSGSGKKADEKANKKVNKKVNKKGGAKIFKSHLAMMEHLSNLIDSIDVGNTSLSVKNEIMDIIDILLKSRKISKKEHQTIYNNYVKQ